LKNILLSDVLLSYPDLNHPFKVATDASQSGLGAVLYQELDGKKHYVLFASRALTISEKNYGITKRELLAFELLTDHKALIFLQTQKQLNRTLLGWLDQLMEYDFTVTHIAGIKNILPDILSRFYEDEVSAESINQQICEKTISSILLSEKQV
jgi:hypothetical protein